MCIVYSRARQRATNERWADGACALRLIIVQNCADAVVECPVTSMEYWYRFQLKACDIMIKIIIHQKTFLSINVIILLNKSKNIFFRSVIKNGFFYMIIIILIFLKPNAKTTRLFYTQTIDHRVNLFIE